jgi:hypothetical protein
MAHDTDGPRKGEVEFKNGRPVHTTDTDDDQEDDDQKDD